MVGIDVNFLLKELKLFAEFFPQFKTPLNEAITSITERKMMLNPGKTPWSRILYAIDTGYQVENEIQESTNIEPLRLKKLLKEMVEAEVLEPVEQGGKTDGARGQRKILYCRIQH